MKEATARQIESMKAQTIGVEVEMYGISRILSFVKKRSTSVASSS